MINITIIATRRADILEKTLSSFRNNVLSKYTYYNPWPTVYINIDPVGPDKDGGAAKDVTLRHFMDSNVFFNEPAAPSFPKAFKWVLDNVGAEYSYVFHLEDDWEFLRPVNINRMLLLMAYNPDLAILRLPWKPTGPDSMKNWKYFFPWNGEFFECPKELRRTVGFCGHPSLIRMKFIRNTIQHIDDTRNPEKQFHHGHPKLMKEIDRWRYGVFAEPNQGPAIRDVGRQWMIKNGLKKAGNKAFFTQWEKIDG